MSAYIKQIVLAILGLFICASGFTQGSAPALSLVKKVEYTSVKNQSKTGTCWSFSTTSLIESQTKKNGFGEFDLSEMFTVRNIYVEKARNYILRQGIAQFGAGGLGHDVIRSISNYGVVPESIYSGLLLGEKNHNHSNLDLKLKSYLDALLANKPVPNNWMEGFQSILDDNLGKVPTTFIYREKQYTPITFALEVLHFNSRDYVNITSFSHHPFYTSFILEAPDNFLNGSYYNIPLGEMINLTTRAVESGYSVMWDADVSNEFFRQRQGFALQWRDVASIPKVIDPEAVEMPYNQKVRQTLYENLTTQDDHLMHLVGIEKSSGGKNFFLVKNSWGEIGPYKGLIHVSEAYFAINTISLVVPKEALDSKLKVKLGM